jgi:hypothetical protein
MSKRQSLVIFLIVRPGYGDCDGMPVSAFTKRSDAVKACKMLNSQWDATTRKYFRRAHGGLPFRVRPFPIDQQRIVLDGRRFAEFSAEMANPREPNAALHALFKKVTK